MAKSPKNRRSRAKDDAQRRAWQRWPLLLAAGAVLVVVIVAGLAVVHPAQTLTPKQSATPAAATASDNPAQTLTPKQSATPAATTASDPSLGPASAPVTLIEYGDFGCTTCQAWEQAGVLKAARQEYGDKLHFVWRDFPVITAESPKAAEAGRYANDQGKFWDYHDLLYQRAPALSVADLKTYAGQLNLDTAVFNQCLDSGQHKPIVDAETQAAFQLGFRGTPSFLLNGQPLVGPPTLAYLEQLINPLL